MNTNFSPKWIAHYIEMKKIFWTAFSSLYRAGLYVDNECTRSIFAGKRVSCRNLEIGVLTKFLQFLEVHLGTDYEVLVKRVPTHSNVWADRLSRWKTGPDTCPVKNPISWLIGGLEFGSSVHSTGKQPCSGVATPGSTTVSEQD